MTSIVCFLAGCGGSARIAEPIPLRPGPVERAPGRAADIVATVNGVPVRGEELEAGLREAAGPQVLRDVVLDRLVTAELDRRGIRLTETDLAAERDRLDEALDGGDSLADSVRVREALRRRLGLGPARLEATVRRSAGLRKLVAESVAVTPADVALAERVRLGPRHVLRVIEVATAAEAAEARREAMGGLDAFARVAAARSLDASGPAGGLIGGVSLEDPAYPEALRRAAAALQPGGVSDVVALDESFVVVRLDGIEAPRPGLPEAERERMRRELQRRKERVAMEAEADRLFERASISVLDESIAWNWESPQ